MLRLAASVLVTGTLSLPAPAIAAEPAVSVHASTTRGAAPLLVTFTAVGDAASYRWDLGDGSVSEGAVVHHTYQRGGRYAVVLTATAAGGEVAVRRLSVAALAISLRAPRVADYGREAVFRGRIAPASPRARVVLRQDDTVVARGRTKAGGRFRMRAPVRSSRPFRAMFEDAVSAPASVAIRPVLRASLHGSRLVGEPLTLVARVRPAAIVRIRVFRRGIARVDRLFASSVRLSLDTRSARRLTIRLSTSPAPGFVAARRMLRVLVQLPALALGDRGPSVRRLQERLTELRFALPGVSGHYGSETYEAVLAFQKLHWLPRTGRVTPAVWRRLQRAPIPRPRYFGRTHIEVDKGRQLLFDVVHGKLRRVVHVSTGATGNTPVGVWRIYRKVPGWDWILWYPMYFLRGFAVHGYPFVPPYPASHGCVRVPMWLAQTLYSEHGYGSAVIVY